MHVNRGVLKMKKQVKYLSLLSLAMVALLVSFVGGAFGQSATGTITGTITDPKGLAMVGVTVTVHDVNTGVDHTPVMTNDQGIYNIPLLPPDNYEVTAAQTGFATVKRSAVDLQVGQTARIDIEMPVSAQQTLVTVTTEIPVLDTEKEDRDVAERQRGSGEQSAGQLPQLGAVCATHPGRESRRRRRRHELPRDQQPVQQHSG